MTTRGTRTENLTFRGEYNDGKRHHPVAFPSLVYLGDISTIACYFRDAGMTVTDSDERRTITAKETTYIQISAIGAKVRATTVFEDMLNAREVPLAGRHWIGIDCVIEAEYIP